MEYYIVNSFTNVKFKGNPAGIIVINDFPKEEIMQNIAKQLNLVETVFIKKNNSENYKFTFRYFTPHKELPIAGHPTVAGLKVIYKIFDITTDISIIINTKKGELETYVKHEGIDNKPVFYLTFDNIKHGKVIENRGEVAKVLDIDEKDLVENMSIKTVDAGLGHIIVPVKSGLSTPFKTIFSRTLNIYIQQVLGNLMTRGFCGYYTN